MLFGILFAFFARQFKSSIFECFQTIISAINFQLIIMEQDVLFNTDILLAVEVFRVVQPMILTLGQFLDLTLSYIVENMILVIITVQISSQLTESAHTAPPAMLQVAWIIDRSIIHRSWAF